MGEQASSINRRGPSAAGNSLRANLGVIIITTLGGCHGAARLRNVDQTPSIRAVWVTRWDYKSPADIATLMENCRRAGFNTVLFQVRGNGTVFYRSRIEPWGDELGGRDPGFDPLEVACREGRRRGLSVHAWVNVMPGWRGDEPPRNPRQLYHAHPEWFLKDSAGRRQPLGWYVSLNPCFPEVRAYLVSVMWEIVSHYPIDGLHLDYIRFPNERSKAYAGWPVVPDYPRDPRTLSLFREATGGTPEKAPQLWIRWRSQQVTQLVQDIRSMMRNAAPQVMLSAAVGSDPVRYQREHFQDARDWVARGLIDAVYPMNYAADEPTFERRLRLWSPKRSRIPVITGVMLDKRDGVAVARQMTRAFALHGHVAAFAYNSLFERLDPSGRPIADAQSASRTELRRVVIPQLRRFAVDRLATTRSAQLRSRAVR